MPNISHFIVRDAEAQRFELPGLEFTAMAAPSRGSAGLCTWRLAVAAGLDSPVPHTIDEDEVFMVTAGAVKLSPDGETVHAGDTAIVPAGTEIQLSNPGETPAEVIVAIRAGFSAKGADGAPVGTPPWAL
jgi:mannose-6-phosphate isomerase-like protein (cupin superfamily)